MKIRLDRADTMFSKYIRLRDGKCMRCGRVGSKDKGGLPILGLQCSHYFGRGRESTRFDPTNCDALCFGCHQIWGSEDREGYRVFKVNQLGEKGFNNLILQANLVAKKDRKMSYIIAKALFDDLSKEQ